MSYHSNDISLKNFLGALGLMIFVVGCVIAIMVAIIEPLEYPTHSETDHAYETCIAQGKLAIQDDITLKITCENITYRNTHDNS